MKAIILSAGQGRRLAPLTDDSPKCTVPVQGRTLIEWQIDQLVECGVDDITAVVVFGAAHVEKVLGRVDRHVGLSTLYNPFFEVADNLVSCWLAREEMSEDFVLLNGDTLFEPAVLQRLLDAPQRPITLARDHKAHYDADDMKMHLAGDRLLAIGKKLPDQQVDAESIGMSLFRGEGPALFRAALERNVRRPEAMRQWYLSVIGQLAEAGQVWTRSIEGLDWSEVDYPLDLVRASKMVSGWFTPEQTEQAAAAR